MMGPVTLSAWTFLIASMVLLPFLIWERRRDHTLGGSDGPLTVGVDSRERPLLSRRNVTGFLMVGIFGLVPASAFLAWGVNRSSASNAALIYLTVPIMTALLASVILKERMTLARWARVCFFPSSPC